VKAILSLIDMSVEKIFALMEWAAKHGIWEMVTAIAAVSGLVVGFKVLFWAKRRVRGLNFFVSRIRDASNFPLKVNVEFRNYTGRSVVISVPYFVIARLRPDPNARGDSPTGEIEFKFPDRASNNLTEVEYLLRHRENVSTWIPIDPAHTDEEVDAAIKQQRVGKLHCMCTWLKDKPEVHRLVRRL
jgi:hypothetical protein